MVNHNVQGLREESCYVLVNMHLILPQIILSCIRVTNADNENRRL